MNPAHIEAFAAELTALCLKHKVAIARGSFFADPHGLLDGFSFEPTRNGNFHMLEQIDDETTIEPDNVNVRAKKGGAA